MLSIAVRNGYLLCCCRTIILCRYQSQPPIFLSIVVWMRIRVQHRCNWFTLNRHRIFPLWRWRIEWAKAPSSGRWTQSPTSFCLHCRASATNLCLICLYFSPTHNQAHRGEVEHWLSSACPDMTQMCIPFVNFDLNDGDSIVDVLVFVVFREKFQNQISQAQRTLLPPPGNRRQIEIKKKAWSVDTNEAEHHSYDHRSSNGVDVSDNSRKTLPQSLVFFSSSTIRTPDSGVFKTTGGSAIITRTTGSKRLSNPFIGRLTEPLATAIRTFRESSTTMIASLLIV